MPTFEFAQPLRWYVEIEADTYEQAHALYVKANQELVRRTENVASDMAPSGRAEVQVATLTPDVAAERAMQQRGVPR